MSFGGFGGFGSNNNNQSSGGFGGFGANNNNNNSNSNSGGFGSNTNTGSSIFGSNNNTTGSNMFGSNNNTSSPFGGGGFGSNTSNTGGAFGSKPFGSSTTGGGLFGGGASGSTFGGFGSNSSTTTTTSAFGSNNNTTGGGLFGGAKTGGFGSSTTAGGLFGGGGSSNTTGGFGASTTNTTGGFGASTGGFGAAANNQPNNGTASTPFSAYTEKDGASSNSTQHFQTITFQQPYTNYSLEELRLADYNQGRRYGNQNGQAGAFGQSTGFGGFGSTNNTTTTNAFGSNAASNTSGGLFGGGANNNTTSTFGQSTGGFGANNNTGGGLFGQNKPATGGLFGSTGTTANTNTGGGLFGGGSTANTTGGFGTTGGGFGSSTTTGGGLFGNNNANQQKPAGGLFGGGAATTTNSNPFGGAATNTTTNAFGQSNTGGGGLFGQNNTTTNTGGFGANNAAPNTGGGGLFGNTGGAFGQNNNQAQNNTTGGGLFGQPKPATGGLFGSSTTANTGGGGLFGQQNNATQQSGGLFGNSTANNNAGGGLFGQKPPATGGLFGNTNTNTGAATGGLFGGLGTQNTQQNTGGSLFGNQNNQPKTGGLFGASAGTNTGGGLFGGMGQSTNQQSAMGNSLFQSQNNQQQNQGPANSLFGASGSSLLSTSMGTNPYGNDALFAGLATPTQSPGPLATPLSSSQKNKKSAILPQHKLNPAASTRLLTPQNKRPGGYGFTYSTYGTPSSVSSQSNSPGFGGSLFSGGAMSRSLSKSLSTSNLRNSFTPETSILSPGAFSTSTRGSGYGSLKRLNVRKDLNTRIPLFDEPPQKRVSFANGEGDNFNGMANGDSNALVVRRDEDDASPRSSHGDMGGETPRASNERVNGNHQLARVAEDSALTPKSSSAVNAQPGKDVPLGPYWSQPSLDQLKQMSKQELKSVKLIIGREGVGQITFNIGKPIDMSEVDLDKVFGDIVDLTARNATVYGANCTALPKPVLGTGLNHPSEIVLGNSWPRNRAGKKDAKHLERLRRVGGTTFLDYNQATGEWSFTVPHFSSYGLDYDGEEYSDLDEAESSELSPAPDTPAQSQLRSSQMSGTPQDDSFVSPQSQSSPDDTFDFKKGMRSRASVPGGFGDEPAYEEDQEMEETNGQSFLGQRSVVSLDGQQDDDYYDESESELVQDQNMADSDSPIQTTEQVAAKGSELMRSMQPKSILKASHIFKPGNGTPAKSQQPIFDDDWANQLQRTISPRKQDRTALRETQGDAQRVQESAVPKLSQSIGGRNLTTAMDLMESLFGETEKQTGPKRGSHGIELPYPKRPKTADDLNQLSEDDKKFHGCSKPHFSENGIIIYGNKGTASLEDGLLSSAQEPLIGAAKDVRFAQVRSFADATPETLALQKKRTKIGVVDGVPFASLQTEPAPVEFSEVAKAVAIDTTAGTHEQRAWQLLSLLFDDADKVPEGIKPDQISIYKKEQLSDFWRDLVWDDAQKHGQQAISPEEKAIAHLSCNSVPEACHALLEGLDLRLATMIAQIGGDANTRQNMSSQIDEWRRLDVLSEMDDSHRTLYELLAGNCAQSEGKTGPGRENKAATFGISARFALDWRRAFGLRLWYGIMADEPIELAVAQFADAIRDGLENVKPVPWFVESNTITGWVDDQAEHREDLLWGILKLYAASKMNLDANIEDVLAPENTSGNPLNARLSFQLYSLFKSRRNDSQEAEERKVDMPTARGDGESEHRSSFISSTASRHEKDTQAREPLVELGDKITLTYAASLHSRQHWTTAIWVYSHLSSPGMREHFVKSLLNQFAKTYSLDESDLTYAHLTRDMQIPETWLHAAAALQAKADDDALRQATHLIKADELEEAHDVLCRKVGPDAIISRDYDPLRELIGGFLPDSSKSPNSDRASVASTRAGSRRKEPVQGWSQGGQIYFDYIELIDLTSQRSAYRVDEGLNQDIQDLLVKLQRALEVAARDRLETCGLEERVALMEIAGTVAGQLAKNQHASHASILRLPLTEDLRLKHSCALSTMYYRNVMAGGR